VKIPDIIDVGDFSLLLMPVPNDVQHKRAVLSSLYALTRGRYWKRDERDTSIKDVTAVYRSLLENVQFMSVSEISTALNGIASAIREYTRLNGCGCDETPPTTDGEQQNPDIPAGDSWGDVEPPLWYEGSYNDFVCDLLNRWYYNLVKFLKEIEALRGVVVVVGLVTSLLAVVFPEPFTTAIGTVSLASIAAGIIAYLFYHDAIAGLGEEFREWAEITLPVIVCQVKGYVDLYEGFAFFSHSLADTLSDMMQARGVPEIVADGVVWWLKYPNFLVWYVDYFLDDVAPLFVQPPIEYLIPCSCGCGIPDVSSCGVELTAGSLLSVTEYLEETGSYVTVNSSGGVYFCDAYQVGHGPYSSPGFDLVFSGVHNVRVISVCEVELSGSVGAVPISQCSVESTAFAEGSTGYLIGASSSTVRGCIDALLDGVLADNDVTNTVQVRVGRPGEGNSNMLRIALRVEFRDA